MKEITRRIAENDGLIHSNASKHIHIELASFTTIHSHSIGQRHVVDLTKLRLFEQIVSLLVQRVTIASGDSVLR